MKIQGDPIAGHNERMKGLGSFRLGYSLAIIGFAFLRPAIELGRAIEEVSALWFVLDPNPLSRLP